MNCMRRVSRDFGCKRVNGEGYTTRDVVFPVAGCPRSVWASTRVDQLARRDQFVAHSPRSSTRLDPTTWTDRVNGRVGAWKEICPFGCACRLHE